MLPRNRSIVTDSQPPDANAIQAYRVATLAMPLLEYERTEIWPLLKYLTEMFDLVPLCSFYNQIHRMGGCSFSISVPCGIMA